jgi:hypothetical protein
MRGGQAKQYTFAYNIMPGGRISNGSNRYFYCQWQFRATRQNKMGGKKTRCRGSGLQAWTTRDGNSIFLRFIDTLPQDTGGFENYNPPSPQDEVLFGLGIAAAAGIFAPDAEFAKAADENIFLPGESVFNDIQDTFNGTTRFLLTEPELEINSVDNFFFGQGHGLILLPLV